MTLTGDSNNESRKKIEAYLRRLRVRLCGMKNEEVREIIEELRSHILDKSAASNDRRGEISAARVDDALAALGSPEQLAIQYLTDHLLARAEISRSPLQVLKSSFRWASLSVAGFFVLLGSLLGYCFGAVFILVAILKPLHPHSAGLWSFPNGAGDVEISFRLGFGSLPSGGRDLLGWWIVPIGMAVGCGLVMLTTHIAVWFARQYRRSLVLAQL